MRFIENQKRELIKRKAKFFYNRARELYLSSDIKRPGILLLRMSHAIEDFFATLSQPVTSNRDLVSDGQIPTKELTNERYSNMVTDLDITFAEQNAIEENMISSFNYTQLQKNAITEELEILEGLIDEAEQSVGGDYNVAIRFFDNFVSTDFVNLNTNPVTSEAVAVVDTLAGVLHLAKNAEIDVIGNGDIIQEFSYLSSAIKKVIDHSTIGGIISRAIGGVVPIEGRELYSGKTYGLTFITGSDSVEDGLRIDLSNVDPATNSLLKMVDTEEDSTGESVTTIWEREFSLLDYEANSPFKDLNGAETINVDDIIIDGKVIARVNEANNIRVKRIPFTRGELPGGSKLKDDGRNVGRGGGGHNTFLEVDADHLRFVWGQLPSNVDGAELIMILMVTFEVPKRVSKLTISPHLFGKNVSPRIENIEVYEPSKVNEDGSFGAWSSAVRSANVSTSNLNDDSVDVLSSDSSWVLGNKDVGSILITLKQKKGYKQKYELMSYFGDLKLLDAQGGLRTTHGSEIDNIQYLIDYMGPSLIKNVETTIKNSISDEIASLDPGLNPVNRAHRVDGIVSSVLENALGQGSVSNIGLVMFHAALRKRAGGDLYKFFHSGDPQGREVKRDDGKTHPRRVVVVPSEISNRHRYAIGIRDIDVKYIEYKETSEILTKEFLSPVPIGTIVLKTEEVIPASFAEAKLTLAQLSEAPSNTLRPWISYEVSVDHGQTFHPISPLGGQKWWIKLQEGNKLFQVPTFIEVNSDLPIGRRSIYDWGPLGYIDTPNGVAPKTIIMRIRLERPKAELGAYYTGLTPRLDAYELVVNPGPAGGTP